MGPGAVGVEQILKPAAMIPLHERRHALPRCANPNQRPFARPLMRTQPTSHLNLPGPKAPSPLGPVDGGAPTVLGFLLQ
jgi:hypothetical protein